PALPRTGRPRRAARRLPRSAGGGRAARRPAEHDRLGRRFHGGGGALRRPRRSRRPAGLRRPAVAGRRRARRRRHGPGRALRAGRAADRRRVGIAPARVGLAVLHRRRPPAHEAMRASKVADVVVAGETRVDLVRAVELLGERGFRHVLAEGGPSLNGALAGAGVLDEVCLTVAPVLVSGEAKRIVAGPAVAPPPLLALRSACEEAGYLFLRYRLPQRPAAEPPG